MKLQVTVPKSDTDDIEVEAEIVIVAEVTGFWGYTEDDRSLPLHWGLNPNGLMFSTFPDNFISLYLSKYPHSGEYRLTAEYEYREMDDGEAFKEAVVFKVTSVEEVRDFPLISS